MGDLNEGKKGEKRNGRGRAARDRGSLRVERDQGTMLRFRKKACKVRGMQKSIRL